VVAVNENDGSAFLCTADSGAQFGVDPFGLDETRTLQRVEVAIADAAPFGQAPGARLADMATVLSCADTLGALSKALDIVSSYLVDRTAFGAPVASFQVIQHRLVNLTTLVVSGRSLLHRAAQELADGSERGSRSVHASNVYIQSRAIAALDDCIQLAGGIGFTWEFPLHLSMRRAAANAATTAPSLASAAAYALDRGWIR